MNTSTKNELSQHDRHLVAEAKIREIEEAITRGDAQPDDAARMMAAYVGEHCFSKRIGVEAVGRYAFAFSNAPTPTRDREIEVALAALAQHGAAPLGRGTHSDEGDEADYTIALAFDAEHEGLLYRLWGVSEMANTPIAARARA